MLLMLAAWMIGMMGGTVIGYNLCHQRLWPRSVVAIDAPQKQKRSIRQPHQW